MQHSKILNEKIMQHNPGYWFLRALFARCNSTKSRSYLFKKNINVK